MRSGQLRKRASFAAYDPNAVGESGERLAQWTNVTGGTSVPCSLEPVRSQEVVEAGGTTTRQPRDLVVRSNSVTRTITVNHRVTVDGETFNIRDIINPDQRDRKLVMRLEIAPE